MIAMKKNPRTQTAYSPSPCIGPKATITATLVSLLAAGIAGIAGAATVLTSTTGNVSSGGVMRVQNDVLAASERIDLEGSATASLVLDDTAVVRLCHGASVDFASQRGGGSSALGLRAGQLTISVAGHGAGGPFEIYTPAATATLVGAEAHVEVDLLTGDTVITALAHELKVSGVDAFAGRSVVVSAGEKLTIRNGFGPEAVEAADIVSISFSSACLDDSRYRVAAVTAARNQFGQNSLGTVALMDLEGEATIPTVSAGPPIIPTGTLGPPAAPIVRPCLSYQQCVQASRAAPVFIQHPLPARPPPPGS